MASLAISCRQLRSSLSLHAPAAVRCNHQRIKHFPKPKARGDVALPVKIVNPTPNGFMDYDPNLEMDVTGRQFGFSPTPQPLPPHETMWEGFKANIVGHTPKSKPKKKCRGRMVFNLDRKYLPHSSICAFCRATAENKATNVMFLANFVHPNSWRTYTRWTATGLCQYAEEQVRVLIEDARANGYLPRFPPPVMADYHWKPPGEKLDLRNYGWYTRNDRKGDAGRFRRARFSRQVKHKI